MKIKLSKLQTDDMKSFLIREVHDLNISQKQDEYAASTVSISSVLDLTLQDILNHFGTKTQFKDWIKMIRDIEGINEKRFKLSKERGVLIQRSLVRRGVIEPFDLCFKRLLGDGARTIAVRVVAMVNAGEPIEECERFVSGKLSDFIKNAKTTAEGVINDETT